MHNLKAVDFIQNVLELCDTILILSSIVSLSFEIVGIDYMPNNQHFDWFGSNLLLLVYIAIC